MKEYIEIDKITKQVLSAGSDRPMFGGDIVKVPKLPQRKNPTINITDYYWNGKKFIKRASGNIHRAKKIESIMADPFCQAIIEVIAEHLSLTPKVLSDKIKSKLNTKLLVGFNK